MSILTQAAVLGLAGAAGTLLRAGCTALAVRLLGTGFPWGTIAVNVAGSFAFGAIHSWARARGAASGPREAVLLVGLLGGFTTYSSFSFQAVELLAAGRSAAATAYVVATNAAALLAVWVGLRLFAN